MKTEAETRAMLAEWETDDDRNSPYPEDYEVPNEVVAILKEILGEGAGNRCPTCGIVLDEITVSDGHRILERTRYCPRAHSVNNITKKTP